MSECTYCFGTGEYFNGEDYTYCKKCTAGDELKKQRENVGEVGDKPQSNNTKKPKSK